MDSLIELLQKNARCGDKELAELLGVTDDDIKARVRALEESGVMTFRFGTQQLDNFSREQTT